jgi:predicted nucleic acid-binding protein
VLVAWGWSDHCHHRRAAAWIGLIKDDLDAIIVTSAIPQLGFVRVSMQRTGGQLPASDAAAVLLEMIESLGQRHAFLADDQPSTVDWQDWCNSSAKSTDAHFARLAERHGFRLATFDAGIPGAFLIPLEGTE